MDTKIDKVGRYAFRAEPFKCDFRRSLFMGHLGNAMLNAADFHSEDRGFGVSYLNSIHRTWVLSRLAVEMTDMPKMYDKFFIETWCEGAKRFFTSRNYAVMGEDGKAYGYGKSIWAMIDTDTRQPADILAIRDGLILDYIETEKPCPINRPGRVTVSDPMEEVRQLDTTYSDIDLNGHVNSLKYVEHVLDLFDLDWYREHQLRRFEIAYVSETHFGDRLIIKRQQTGPLTFSFLLIRQQPDGTQHESCRCSLEFR